MKLLLSFLLLLSFANAYAVTFKIGVLAPKGTSWANSLDKVVKEVKKATNGKVKFKVYYGGSQGDEPDVLRKIRVGHLHGGIFTGKTLGEVNGDVRVMEVPFTFKGDRAKAAKVLGQMTPFFNNGFNKNGFVNLGFFEVGQIYLISKDKFTDMNSVKGMKIWAWEGDPVAESFINGLGLVSVPLPSTDVLSALSTGIIQSAYAPPLGMIAMQWNTKIKYLLDFPITYSVGAFLVDKKRWKKVPAKYQKVVMNIMNKSVNEINKSNVRENAESMEVLKSMGVNFVQFPQKDYRDISLIRKDIIKKLQGRVISPKAIQKLESLL